MATNLLNHFIDDIFELDAFIKCSLEGFGYATVATLVTEKVRNSCGACNIAIQENARAGL